MRVSRVATALLVVLALACNNDASDQGEADSSARKSDTNQTNWPEPRDIMGGDSVPSPQTQVDASNQLKK